MHHTPHMKTLLVLGAGLLQIPAISTAKSMGLRVVAFDGDANAPGLKLADRAHVVDIANPGVCLDVARQEHVDGVIHICSEVSMHVLGRINDALHLAGPGYAVAVAATNKQRMRQAFAAGGAPSPLSFPASTESEALAAAAQLGGCIIVKPSRNSGSRGITRIPNAANHDPLIQAFHRALKESRDGGTVIEEFVEGPEFSVEMLVWNMKSHVLAVTDKLTTGAPFFVETGHSQPTRFSDHARQQIVDAAVKGVMALGINGSAAHAEVRLTSSGPKIMEIGARLGGDFITTELVPRSTGIDMVEGAIRLALGEEPDLGPRHPPQGAAIRYFLPKPGRVVFVDGVTEARQMPGVKIVEVSVGVGEVVPEMNSSLARVGHVIAEAPTAAEAVALAERARDTIRISTE